MRASYAQGPVLAFYSDGLEEEGFFAPTHRTGGSLDRPSSTLSDSMTVYSPTDFPNGAVGLSRRGAVLPSTRWAQLCLCGALVGGFSIFGAKGVAASEPTTFEGESGVVLEEQVQDAPDQGADADAFYWTGRALGAEGDFERARVEFEKALVFRPDFIEAEIALATVEFRLDKRASALARLDRLGALPVPLAAQAHRTLARFAAIEDRHSDVLKHYERALKITPENVSMRVNLGIALMDQKQFEKATAVFKKAISQRPKARLAWLNLGRSLYELGETEEAEVTLQRALELDPRSFMAVWHLARIAGQKGQPEEAFELYEQAVELAAARKNVSAVLKIRAEQQML